jgi:hypothetical protein
MEPALKRAVETLSKLCPSAEISTFSDHAGTPRLKAAANGADFFVIATGAAKHAALAAALNGKWIDVLVTDVNSANYLMHNSPKGQA